MRGRTNERTNAQTKASVFHRTSSYSGSLLKKVTAVCPPLSIACSVTGAIHRETLATVLRNTRVLGDNRQAARVRDMIRLRQDEEEDEGDDEEMDDDGFR